MDKASIVGLVAGIVCLMIVLYEVSHGHLMAFFSIEGVLMVGGGTASVLLMAMPAEKLKCVPGYIRRFLFHKARRSTDTVDLLVKLAERARRDGILALEGEMEELEREDPFLATGVRMSIDGMDPASIDATLRIEILSMQERHRAGKKFFDLIKLYGPGWALAGTLIGQIGMFANLEGGDVGKLGHMLALAVCATMYGTVLANAIAGPIGDKLAMRSAEEIANKEMVLCGVLALQQGENPRAVLDKMVAFVPYKERSVLKAAA